MLLVTFFTIGELVTRDAPKQHRTIRQHGRILFGPGPVLTLQYNDVIYKLCRDFDHGVWMHTYNKNTPKLFAHTMLPTTI